MNKTIDVMKTQLLRGHVLQICDEATPIGAGTDVIAGVLVKEGHFEDARTARSAVATICYYLKGKGLIDVKTVTNDVLGISRDIAHITPEGADVLEGTNKIDGIALP